jgi:hypothetical protein
VVKLRVYATTLVQSIKSPIFSGKAGYARGLFMFRYKTIVGDRLSARKWQTQVAEVKIKLDVINRMTELGMPESYKKMI